MGKGGKKQQGKSAKSRGERKDDLERKRDERAKRLAIRKENKAREYYSPEDDKEYVSFCNQLQTIGLKIKEIPGDGNCLFRSLADQLEGDHNRHVQVRRNTVHFMRNNREDFEPFHDGENTFNEYLEELDKDGTFAGNDAIVAFARNNNVDVIIHQFNNPRFVINAPINPNNIELHLAYHNWEHYSSLRTLDDTSDGPAYVVHKNKGLSQQFSSGGKKMTKPINTGNQKSENKSDIFSALEMSVVEMTNCKDPVLIRQSLQESDYDVDTATAYVFQMLSISEAQEEIKARLRRRKVSNRNAILTAAEERFSEPKVVADENHNCCDDQCQCNKAQSKKENNKSEEKPSIDVKKKIKPMHLSNRQRKELAKQEKKKRREETQKQQAITDKDQSNATAVPDDLGVVAI